MRQESHTFKIAQENRRFRANVLQKSGAVDAELLEIAAVWSHLPAPARSAMLAQQKRPQDRPRIDPSNRARQVSVRHLVAPCSSNVPAKWLRRLNG